MSSTFYNPKDKIKIFNTVVDPVSEKESREILSGFLDEGGFHWIFTPNTEIVMDLRDDAEKAAVMNEADLVVPDGIGLVIGSKMGGHPLEERVTGYDLSIYLLELAKEKNERIFFLGGEPNVAAEAKKRVEEKYGPIVAAEHHGYFKGAHRGYENSEEEAAVIRAINESGASILFVGLGFPQQEQFLVINRDKLANIVVALGNGGVVDVLAYGVPIGLGSHVHWDRRLDARLAGALMGIQAIKGVQVGDGFATAARRGTAAHDGIARGADGRPRRTTDRAGGIEAGMSTGELLRVSAAMKPIATVPRALPTVDVATGAETTAHHQRSDVAAVPAAGIVAEAMVALVLADAMLEKFGGDSVAETRRNLEAFQAAVPALPEPGADVVADGPMGDPLP